MRVIFSIFLAIVLMAASCEKQDSFSPQKSFTLKYGEEKQCDCGDWKVSFTEVKEDSRCPKGVNCVWEGQVVISLQIAGKSNKTMDLVLERDASKASGVYENYAIKLEGVAPYPEEGTKIPTNNYTIDLVVEELDVK